MGEAVPGKNELSEGQSGVSPGRFAEGDCENQPLLQPIPAIVVFAGQSFNLTI